MCILVFFCGWQSDRVCHAGFADGVRGVSPEEAARFEAVSLDLNAYARDLGIQTLNLTVDVPTV